MEPVSYATFKKAVGNPAIESWEYELDIENIFKRTNKIIQNPKLLKQYSSIFFRKSREAVIYSVFSVCPELVEQNHKYLKYIDLRWLRRLLSKNIKIYKVFIPYLVTSKTHYLNIVKLVTELRLFENIDSSSLFTELKKESLWNHISLFTFIYLLIVNPNFVRYNRKQLIELDKIKNMYKVCLSNNSNKIDISKFMDYFSFCYKALQTKKHMILLDNYFTDIYRYALICEAILDNKNSSISRNELPNKFSSKEAVLDYITYLFTDDFDTVYYIHNEKEYEKLSAEKQKDVSLKIASLYRGNK